MGTLAVGIIDFDDCQADMIGKLLNRTIDAVAQDDICSHYLATTQINCRLSIYILRMNLNILSFLFENQMCELLNALNNFILSHRDHYSTTYTYNIFFSN